MRRCSRPSALGGAALALPEGRDRVVEGTRVRLARARGRTLGTRRRGGHTCALSGTADADTLHRLAGWKGKGAGSVQTRLGPTPAPA